MFALGIFAAIYHPVGMPMLLEASKARAGARSPSTASAAISARRSPPALPRRSLPGSAGARPSWCRPSSASAPASSYVVMMPDDRHPRRARKKTADVVLSQRAAMIMFGLYVVISLSRRLDLQHHLTIALPKIVDERLAADVPLLLVGSVATAVLVCGAVAQLCVGRLVEWITPHHLFAVVSGARFRRQSVGGQFQRHAADDWRSPSPSRRFTVR